jgi:transcriptional regulator with XRE-family HTH domain
MIMKFNERLKKLREEKGLTQVQLSELTGISARMIQKYESGNARPRLDAAEKIAKALNITADQLLGNADMLVAQAAEKYGSRGAKQAQQLTEEVTGLFAGGEMAQEDMDVMMKAIQDAYWIAKEKNKKYTPKKYRSEE